MANRVLPNFDNNSLVVLTYWALLISHILIFLITSEILHIHICRTLERLCKTPQINTKRQEQNFSVKSSIWNPKKSAKDTSWGKKSTVSKQRVIQS